MRQVKLYIFDADGTLRWTTVAGQKYPLARDQWRLMPGVAARLLIEDMLVAALGRAPRGARIELCTCDAATPCPCRKPAPGLLLRHLRHFGVAPSEALFVGDLDSDAEAARRAGIAFCHAREFFG